MELSVRTLNSSKCSNTVLTLKRDPWAGERLAKRALGGAGGVGALAELARRAAHRDGVQAGLQNLAEVANRD